MADTRRAYVASGVDVGAGDRAVRLMRRAVESTRRPESIGRLGGFAGAIAIPEGYREPVLVAATDGVGTKSAIASALGRFDTIGLDLVAMCVDDIVCAGAEPLAFLDYVAVGRLDPVGVAELVGGISMGCIAAGCALVGGETAEHPGILEADQFDLSGCAIGVAERDRLLDGSAARPGDAIVGLPSSGLHANGYSLVRSLLSRWDIALGRPYQEQLRLTLGDTGADEGLAAEPAYGLATIGEVLLTPTRIYAGPILRLRTALEAAGHDLRGVAHVTGGGLPGNVPRALPADAGARLDPTLWRMPSVMRLFGALGGIEDDELRATFNGGLGMVVVVPPSAVDTTVGALAREGIEAGVVGEVVAADELEGRYAEGRLAGAWPEAVPVGLR